MLLGLGLLPMQLPAQTFTVLHRFLPDGVDGATASATLTLNSGIIYGITAKGGTNNGGTLFRIETKGTNYQVLHHFASPVLYPTNLDWAADGAGPFGSVAIDSNTIYGATQLGGVAGRGMLYKLGTNGDGYQALHQFLDFHDGSYPSSGLFLSNGWLYGTCLTDGGDDRPNQQFVSAGGTRFAVNTSGSVYHVEGTFQKYVLNPVLLPAYDLVLVPTNAMDTYGFVGISLDKGGFGPEMQSILAIDGHGADGSPFGAIYGMSEGATFFHYHAFTGGADGAYPSGSAVMDGNLGIYVMYGVTAGDGTNTAGTIYRYDVQNHILQVLHTFTNDLFTGSQYLNGMVPAGKLAQIGNTLYGVTKWGGGGYLNGGYGVLYQVNTDGTGFKVLYRFNADKDGGIPMAGLLADGKVLYGTTSTYGSADGSGNGKGTLFKFDLNPPPLWLKPIPGFVISNLVIAITNPNNTIQPVTYITNHQSFPYTLLAMTWNINDAMTHTLVKSPSLSLAMSNWVPVPTNWTNQMQDEVGTFINPNPGDPPTFFRLQSTSQ